MTRSRRYVQSLFWALFGTLLILIFLTPQIIRAGISIFTEEIIEGVLLTLLFLTGLYLQQRYARFIELRESSYRDLVQHIGALNLQLSQVETLVKATHVAPFSAGDITKMFETMGNIVLGVVNVPWVFFRVIETQTIRSVTERKIMRGGETEVRVEVSNKQLVLEKQQSDCSVFTHECGADIRLYLVLPTTNVTNAQSTLVQSVVANTAMIYQISVMKNEK